MPVLRRSLQFLVRVFSFLSLIFVLSVLQYFPFHMVFSTTYFYLPLKALVNIVVSFFVCTTYLYVISGSKVKLTRARKLMVWLNDRLNNLEVERENVQTFNDLNRKKNSLQLCQYESEIEKLSKTLQEVSDTLYLCMRAR